MFAPGAGRYLGAAAAVLLFLAALPVVGAVPLSLPFTVGLLAGVLVWGFFAVFFRDPERTPGEGVVSAADGRVRAVDREGSVWRISVFMNVTNVHVNRFPLDGRVTEIEGSGSGFRAAYRRTRTATSSDATASRPHLGRSRSSRSPGSWPAGSSRSSGWAPSGRRENGSG